MSNTSPEQYRSALLMLARAQIGRQRLVDVEASDLVQQTLLEAHRDRERFTGQTPEQLFAWLRGILHHNFLDAYQKARAAKRDSGRKVREADLTESFLGLDELRVDSWPVPCRTARGT
jgi:RNA polymerase sigma-70 factor (ECF subfamily)